MNYGLKLHLKSHETNQENDVTSGNVIEDVQHVFNTVDILNCSATNSTINLNLNEATAEMNSNDEIASLL